MCIKKTIIAALLGFAAFGSMVQAKSHADNDDKANEKLVVSFYQQLFGDKDVSAIDRYLAEDYIQHNPTLPDGRAPLKAAVTQWFSQTPKENVDIQHVASQNGIVFLHVRGKSQAGGVQAIVDIFRVKNGKIVEHWDVIQDAPAQSANAHPMF